MLGRKSSDFLTEESRLRAINDTLPLFWKVGSARSIGYQLVRKDGSVLDLLLDAERVHSQHEGIYTIAALHERGNRVQWQQASIIIKTLRQLTGIQEVLLDPSLPQADGRLEAESLALGGWPGHPRGQLLGTEVIEALLEKLSDVSTHLRGLARTHEEWQEASVEQQRELVLATKSIDKNLVELTYMMAATSQ